MSQTGKKNFVWEAKSLTKQVLQALKVVSEIRILINGETVERYHGSITVKSQKMERNEVICVCERSKPGNLRN